MIVKIITEGKVNKNMIKRIALIIITLIIVLGSIYGMTLLKDTEANEKALVTKDITSAVEVNITDLSDLAQEIEYTITEDEVVNYCKGKFEREVKVIERISYDSYSVCFADDESIVFEVYASMRAGDDQPDYYDSMSNVVGKIALNELQMPEGLSFTNEDPFLCSFYVDIHDTKDITTIADYYYKLLDALKKLGKEDYDKIFLETSVFHDYMVWRDKLIYRIDIIELDNMSKNDFITMLTKKYYNREDMIEYFDVDGIEQAVNNLFERVDAYDGLGISFKLTVKPAWVDIDKSSMIFQNKDDLKLSKEEYQEKFRELFSK